MPRQTARRSKVTAPTLVSPIANVRLATALPEGPVTLVWQGSKGTFVDQPYTYRVQLQNVAGAVLEERTTTSLSVTMAFKLDVDTQYRWRVRAELDGTFGPWSTVETFRSLDEVAGYIRGNELYDPLTKGVSVGRIIGPHTWIPGVGLRLDTQGTWIEYTLPVTLTEGEYSVLASGFDTRSGDEDPKERVITMREGDGPMNDNEYRMSVDKRGNGAVAFRFITGNNQDYVETQGAERVTVDFHESLTYLVRATWRGNFFDVEYREGAGNGSSGRQVYHYGKPYDGVYQPSPHNVFVGSPWVPGQRGEPLSVEDMVVRHVWLSPNSRPAFAMK